MLYGIGPGGRRMAHFRLYFLDRNDHIRHAVSLECVDDAEAIQLLDGHRNGGAMELWQGVRLVTRIEAEQSQALRP